MTSTRKDFAVFVLCGSARAPAARTAVQYLPVVWRGLLLQTPTQQLHLRFCLFFV